MTNRESLRNARTWMEEACENVQMDSPLRFLIGAKKERMVSLRYFSVLFNCNLSLL